MTFWPLVFHILIFLFLKTRLHRDLLVEWTQTYIMWEQIGSICKLKRLHRKAPYEEKNWQFVVKWSTICAIYFMYTDLCWLSHQIDRLQQLQPSTWSRDRSAIVDSRKRSNKGSPLQIWTKCPPQCFSRSRDLVVEVVGEGRNSRAHKAQALDMRKFHNSLQFISGCQIDKFGQRKRLAIGKIWKKDFWITYINLEVVTVYLRDITHLTRSKTPWSLAPKTIQFKVCTSVKIDSMSLQKLHWQTTDTTFWHCSVPPICVASILPNKKFTHVSL